MRVDGKFVDAEGEPPTDGQYVRRVSRISPIARTELTLFVSFVAVFQGLLYLLRRCYGLIYRLISSSEPVSEELMPIVRVIRPLSSTSPPS